MGEIRRTRRQLLRDSAAVGAAATLTSSPLAYAARRSKPTVAVLGGGMAGLAAAHELIERGFDVTVYEKKALGGKARSIPKPGTAADGRKDLPGEHGFRFFPGFYHHVPDTMRRIPYSANENGVGDNLVSAPTAQLSLVGQEDITAPFGFTGDTLTAITPQALAETLVGALGVLGRVPLNELGVFIQRVAVFLSSCPERRLGQWEGTGWLDFIKAEGKSENYTKLLGAGLTRALVAAKPDLASARTIGTMGEAFIMNILGRGNDGDPDRVLNGPTNEVWIDPWVKLLKGRGVKFRVGWVAQQLKAEGGKIGAATVVDPTGRARRIEADWFVCAVPAEKAVGLMNKRVYALDPDLEGLNELFVDWMVGIQYFLKRDAPLTAGHMAYMDSQWALTSINQAQFWDDRDIARDYGDGSVKDILSVDVSEWEAKGLNGKIAKDCTAQEIADEVWAQMKASVNDRSERLRDEDLHSWHLDPGITWSGGVTHNEEPLLVNTAGSWKHRPRAGTAIHNLLLAGDHCQTNIDLATMEGANESGREAVNEILARSNSKAEKVKKYQLLKPPEFEPIWQQDLSRYKAGQKNVFDV